MSEPAFDRAWRSTRSSDAEAWASCIASGDAVPRIAGHVTALVGINRSGDVTTVRLPGRAGVIRDYSDEDVEVLLRSLAV
jgi:hypothetical protein